MKRIILIGTSGSGKTTLKEALRGEPLEYRKTQYINFAEDVIDTPGEYAEGNDLGGALAVYSFEADVVGLVLSAAAEFSEFPPACAAIANRPVIGIVTKCDACDGRIEAAKTWLEDTGADPIFLTSAKTGTGIKELLDFLCF